MKIRIFGLLMFVLAAWNGFGQDAATAVNDDELKRYAVMMDSIDEMRTSLLAEISEMVKSSEGVSVARYNELFKIINDEAKLTAANATPEEIAAVKAIQARKDLGTAQINDTYKTLAKEYVGASTFNKVKKALDADPALKTKYQSMLDELKADNGS